MPFASVIVSVLLASAGGARREEQCEDDAGPNLFSVGNSSIGTVREDSDSEAVKRIADEEVQAGKNIAKAQELRRKYRKLMADPGDVKLGSQNVTCSGGLCFFAGPGNSATNSGKIWEEFKIDFTELKRIFNDGATRSFTHQRLKILSDQYKLWESTNDVLEMAQMTQNAKEKHADFSQQWKVDNHIHLSGGMTAEHLRRFVEQKVKSKEERKRNYKWKVDGVEKSATLGEFFDSQGLIEANNITVEELGVRSQSDYAKVRFDRFNKQFEPFGNPLMRELFLKTGNSMDGRFQAELTKEMCEKLQSSHNRVLVEWRISVYGRSAKETAGLAEWFEKWKTLNLFCESHATWLLQVPRVYQVWKKQGFVKVFQDMLQNIFEPILKAESEGKGITAEFLSHVVGIDSVDDESQPEISWSTLPTPEAYEDAKNPPYLYHIFWLWINMRQVNMVRKQKKVPFLELRPHCGEAGPIDNLAVGYLLADGINHGLRLYDSSVMQYLYYLDQVPIALSPLSNSRLFTKYASHPAPKFMSRGLHVSLSTDDPLMFHLVGGEDDTLIEEYSAVWNAFSLSPQLLVEAARNSVLMSGFSQKSKDSMLKIADNAVTSVRLTYRKNTLRNEQELVQRLLAV